MKLSYNFRFNSTQQTMRHSIAFVHSVCKAYGLCKAYVTLDISLDVSQMLRNCQLKTESQTKQNSYFHFLYEDVLSHHVRPLIFSFHIKNTGA